MAGERTVPPAGLACTVSNRHVREEVRRCMSHAPVFQVEDALPDIFPDLLAALDGTTEAASEPAWKP